jgi:GNAT superfamily N-acetyltransferase
MENNQLHLSYLSCGDGERVVDFIVDNFKQDNFYADVIKSDVGNKSLRTILRRNVSDCTKSGIAVKVEDGGQIVAVLMAVNYNLWCKLHPESLTALFTCTDGKMKAKLMGNKVALEKQMGGNGEYIYILNVTVAPDYRRQGIAKNLIGKLIQAYGHYNIITDVSNSLFSPCFKNFGFEQVDSVNDCAIFVRYAKDSGGLCGEVQLLLPLSYPAEGGVITVDGIRVDEDAGCFVADMLSSQKVRLAKVPFSFLQSYQRQINLVNCVEKEVDFGVYSALCYVKSMESTKSARQIFDGAIYSQKHLEWDLQPDVITSVPITYGDLKKIEAANGSKYNYLADRIISALNFRVVSESSIQEGEDEGFKNRIKHYFLGTVRLQLVNEVEFSFNKRKDVAPCGEGYDVCLIVTVDVKSSVGVLHIVSLSSGFLLTQYLDSVSRNQIYVQQDGKRKLLYSYILENFALTANGKAKNFVNCYKRKDEIDDNLLASILCNETYYEDDEGFGHIVDKEVTAKVEDEHGFAIYDYAAVYKHDNIIFQSSAKKIGSVDDRVSTLSITLFYVELTVMEESAINFVNANIVRYLSDVDARASDETLKEFNKIQCEYAKTIEFWDIQMNYTSSKKSVDGIRKAFKIDETLARYNRNQILFKDIYMSMRDNIDRMQTKIITLLGLMLTIISILELIFDTSKLPILGIGAGVLFICIGIKTFFLHHKKKK